MKEHKDRRRRLRIMCDFGVGWGVVSKGVSGVYIGEGGFVRGEKGEFVGGMYVWGDGWVG